MVLVWDHDSAQVWAKKGEHSSQLEQRCNEIRACCERVWWDASFIWGGQASDPERSYRSSAINNLVKYPSDDMMQGMCGAILKTIGMFIGLWLVFVIFAPCLVPFFAFGICGLVYSCVWPRNDYDKMFPSSPSIDISLVSLSPWLSWLFSTCIVVDK